MSKTPFELRFDSLMLARDHLVSEYEASINRATLYSDEELRHSLIVDVKYPTLEEIYIRANEIKDFVNGKSDKQ